MKVCNVVKNSIWYDPRVKKQIRSYIENGIELICVGVQDPRYNQEEIEKLLCPVCLTKADETLYRNGLSIIKKI